jgi:polyhydroxyalkanoate synthesis regulator phasin
VSASEPDQKGGASDALRSAIEKTFAATADQAAETRERAGELLDDVTRRGQEAREEVSRRGQEALDEDSRRGQEARDEVSRRGHEAREAPKALVDRIGGTLQRLRGGADTDAMRREIESLRKRVGELEGQLRKAKSKVKG